MAWDGTLQRTAFIVLLNLCAMARYICVQAPLGSGGLSHTHSWPLEPVWGTVLTHAGKETSLYYTILYYTILYYTILYYTILYYTILYYTILYYYTGCVSIPVSVTSVIPRTCDSHTGQEIGPKSAGLSCCGGRTDDCFMVTHPTHFYL